MDEFYMIPIDYAKEWAFLDIVSCIGDHKCLEDAWTISPNDTLRVLLWIRDCHGNGLCQRETFYKCMQWLSQKDPELIINNLAKIVEHGYWKDLLLIWEYSSNELVRASIIYFYCNQLQTDLIALDFGEPLSLASKWAPTEKCSLDKRMGIVSLFCTQLKLSRKRYRKMLSVLREALEVSERLICQQRPAELDFDKMPARAIVKHDMYLRKNCGNRFIRWLDKSKPQCLTEIIARIRKGDATAVDAWSAGIKNVSAFTDTMCICDTSQSMVEYSSINVSMTLALVIANTCRQPFSRKLISFSEAPEIINLPESVSEQCHTIQNIKWGFNINIISAIEKIAVEIGSCPKQLFIITDSPWYQAQYPKNIVSDKELIRDVCHKYGVTPPEHIIYWNVNTHQNNIQFENKYVRQGVTIINGFSVKKFNQILESGILYPVDYISSILEMSR